MDRQLVGCLVWICCVAGLAGCYPDSFGAHPCAGCLECEECVEGPDGPRCAATPAVSLHCAADGNVHSYDSCDADEGVFDHCPEHAECVETSDTEAECVCTENWLGDECNICPGNWDEEQDCAACQTNWTGADCETCPGNWDPAQNCEECLPGWEGADCETQLECYGGWLDPVTSLCWEDPPPDELMSWVFAVAYCDDLVLGSLSDWHMPTISELRSLVRDCPTTETGGECGVTDGCGEFDCWGSAACAGCTDFAGPGLGGCYWDPSLSGSCSGRHWASTPCLDQPDSAWRIWFKNGELKSNFKNGDGAIRCVRSAE